tara:strand:+ start:1624 stop:2250 length:627 start_codon:yes stop_codon:yes gene_type:complete
MKKNKIGILDLNAGNIFSVYKVFSQIDDNVEIIENYDSSQSFSHIVVPGVASFGMAVKNLKEKNFDILLNDFISKKKPILGLCVGCQILFGTSSEFGFHNGLNFINGKVKKLPNEKYKGAKLPQVGWFRIKFNSENKLFHSINLSDFFYFTHSFHCVPEKNENILATYNFHNEEIVAAVIKENIIGLQFHPELSSYAGKRILKNFLKL